MEILKGRVLIIENQVADLKSHLGTANNKGEISWIIDRLENEKGCLLRALRQNKLM